ncbi:MAG: Qat anti-phage system TatD family nuclease QatD [Candidatus Halalkalibacterium sp. M3_1C_030]
MNSSSFVDTHFHLDLCENISSIVNSIEKNKIYTIAVTNSPTVFEHTFNVCEDKKYLRPAIGLHPELVYQRYQELDLVKDHIKRTRYVGEVGLDYSTPDSKTKSKQKEVFEQILKCCSSGEKKVLTVHSRKAEKDVVAMIGDNYHSKVILHWYSGNLTILEKAIEYGFYFSFNYQMLNTKKGQKILSKVPVDRILTESDGPFVKVKNEVATPNNIHKTINKIANCLSKSVEETKEIVFKNFRQAIST